MAKNLIDINGVIDDWGYMTSVVRYRLSQMEDTDVTVRVNSLGGSVNEALAISRAFADHGRVTCQLVGFCASAATFLVYGAARVEMADDGFWLCHRCTAPVDILGNLNADDIAGMIRTLRNQKKSQEAIDLTIARKYQERAEGNGKEADIRDILSLMQEERWLTAQEVCGLGFVDGLIKNARSVSDSLYSFMQGSVAALHLPGLANRERKPSIIERMKDFLSGNSQVAAEPEQPQAGEPETEATDTPAPTEEQPKNEIIMEKDFKNVGALLGGSMPKALDDGSVILNAGQMQLLEDALAAAKNESENIAGALDVLDGVSDFIKGMSGLNNKVLALADVVKRTPITQPARAVNVADPEKARLEAIRAHATDPINEEAMRMKRQ